MKKYYQNAIFVHGHSHLLNLVKEEVSSHRTEVGGCLAMCNKVKQAEYRSDKQPVGLTNAGDTRWSSHAMSVTKA